VTTVGRVAMAVAAGVLLLASAVSAQSATGSATAGDLLPFVERLGFPALAFFLMWRLVTQELRRNAEANERVAAALASLAAEVAAMREHARR
jgi:hypothetical protein